MQLYMLTTTFPSGLLESPEFLSRDGKAREAYRAAAPMFEILSSYKIDSDKTLDIVQAANDAEAKKAADAIAQAQARLMPPPNNKSKHAEGGDGTSHWDAVSSWGTTPPGILLQLLDPRADL